MATVQYLVPVSESATGQLVHTACVDVETHESRTRELLRAGHAASALVHEFIVGPGLTIHVNKAVRLH